MVRLVDLYRDIKKYLHSNIPHPIRIRLKNKETDNPMAKVMQFDLSCFIIIFSGMSAKTR